MYILELSKVLMCEFHCDYIKNRYDSKSKLLLKDTDSFLHEIKTEHVYKDFGSNKKFFISVIIRPSQNTIIIQANWLLVKQLMKAEALQLKNLIDQS